MFGSSSNSSNSSKANYERANTLLGEGTILESAVFKASGTVRIDGSYSGKLIIDGDLVVSEKGSISGDIQVNHALIAGKIIGDIKGISEIHMSSTSIVKGTISCKSLIIDEGACFEGTSKMALPKSFEEPIAPIAPIADSTTKPEKAEEKNK